ncbi:hypothetical protein [Azospirillum argentinense]|uniref:hypothetical protein n=1 Tax=Azospirillum argentinense TaxID=2970906 RepID=UPI0010BFDD48|nr:hypothetical protein [Azospirillum argentinense]
MRQRVVQDAGEGGVAGQRAARTIRLSGGQRAEQARAVGLFDRDGIGLDRAGGAQRLSLGNGAGGVGAAGQGVFQRFGKVTARSGAERRHRVLHPHAGGERRGKLVGRRDGNGVRHRRGGGGSGQSLRQGGDRVGGARRAGRGVHHPAEQRRRQVGRCLGIVRAARPDSLSLGQGDGQALLPGQRRGFLGGLRHARCGAGGDPARLCNGVVGRGAGADPRRDVAHPAVRHAARGAFRQALSGQRRRQLLLHGLQRAGIATQQHRRRFGRQGIGDGQERGGGVQGVRHSGPLAIAAVAYREGQ